MAVLKRAAEGDNLVAKKDIPHALRRHVELSIAEAAIHRPQAVGKFLRKGVGQPLGKDRASGAAWIVQWAYIGEGSNKPHRDDGIDATYLAFRADVFQSAGKKFGRFDVRGAGFGSEEVNLNL